ncbi:hypothetical protein CAEBREN_30889 [Caenorhabditis brenneri]|uniref:Integrase catalytic domain-containing protein n=1 Tax=Caenorhabditis brenneri TaxID=135651 RepID=G0P3Q5_CAEBE|nr:hypothetical protein CAEBREN_30889 [Caenorhabditis brenneri]
MLGMIYDARKDTMTMAIPKPPEGKPTKKALQSFLARIYDPLGVLAPLTVRLKQFLQSLWATKIGWKQSIPKDTMPIWESIKKDFLDTEYTMNRQITDRYDYKSTKLIIFSDASKNNYGVAAYLRFEFPDKTFKTKLLMAKSRVKPLKGSERLTIPRLELMALWLATNCAVYIKNELHSCMPFESVEFFSDSMIALAWTTTQKPLKCFVANKVKLIKENCKILRDCEIEHKFHYVPTEQNPADLTTRGKNSKELFASKMWHDGPEFLEKKEGEWPNQWKDSPTIPKWLEKAMAEEVVGKEGKTVYKEEDGIQEHVVHLTTATEYFSPGNYESWIPYDSTNSISKLIRYTEKVIRATRKLSGKREWENPIMKKYMAAKPGVEGYEERRKAVLYSLILDHYKDTASRMEHVIPEDLNPMQDQFGLIRHGTRLDKSDLPTDTKLPIILIRDHKLTEMIVRDIHLRNKHIGTEQLVAECRRKYWIPKGRQLARKVINSCTQCRRKNGRTFRYPPIPPLPASRVQRSKPFEHIGIDYFGPIYYKGTHSQRKCWVLICTCVVTRNIHLELVSDNGTVEFILAMRRFFSRRGTPKTVTLDNAKTFKLGEKIFNNDIKEMAEENDTFTNFMDQHPMEWKFITPLSPWKGGVYERIIGIVKKLLYSSGDTGQFNYVQLFTVITEIEGIVNSRPISHNPENFVEGPVVRPADFISPEVKLGVVHDNGKIEMADAGVTEKIARSHMAAMNEHMTELWKKWEDSYLTQLKISHNRRQQYTVTPPKIGQVVIMEEKLKARHKWPLARITEIHPNELGQIRTVTIKCNGKEIKRSVNQLIPLEMEFESPATMAVPTTKEHSSKNTEPTTKSQDAEPDKRREKSKSTTPANSHNPNVRNKIESNDGSEASSDQLRTRPFLSRKAKKGINYCEVAEDQNQKVKVNSENEERRTSEYGSNSTEEMAGRNKPHSHSLGAGSVAN